jgi:hypothetical protein
LDAAGAIQLRLWVYRKGLRPLDDEVERFFADREPAA